MTQNEHPTLTIPKEWNGKQAKTVWEFLESIMDSIWDVHGSEIERAIKEEEQEWLRAARGETKNPSDN
jgi:hypothetical protein